MGNTSSSNTIISFLMILTTALLFSSSRPLVNQLRRNNHFHLPIFSSSRYHHYGHHHHHHHHHHSFFRCFSSSSTASSSLDDPPLDSHVLDDFEKLRGTPELVDRLEAICSKQPGFELNMNLYRALYPFPLDAFQVDGLQALITGKNVLVMTPTGSGKTLVGELAIYFALMMGLRVAYTTPLKALSNQKFQDFKNKFGADRVGLLTGDIAINRGAQVTIMTTEVFRNMLYDTDSRNSQLNNLFMVCFDEFHFMNDLERGTVWEESVISCPSNVRILALSATMGNVEEIQGWISSIHGPTELIRSDHRPVPLRYFFAMRQGFFPFFRDPNAGPGALGGIRREDDTGKLETGCGLNPTILRLEDQLASKVEISKREAESSSGKKKAVRRINPHASVPKYSELVKELSHLQKLPAIVFIFSRIGCEDAAKMLMGSNVKLLNDDEVHYVNLALTTFLQTHPEIPITKQNIRMLQSGISVHHAGLISVWKAFIEDLFNANKIKVLFATETLAAGVNMPARTTVITTVSKRINSEEVLLKPSQLLQMAGRAGRRGKDTEGSVVLVKNRFDAVQTTHRILTSPIDSVKSHFRASYSLTVKLLTTRSLSACKELIERGFGSYLLQKKIAKKEKKMEAGSHHREIVNKFGFASCRKFVKLQGRLEKEQRTLDFLVQQIVESEQDLVSAIVDYMPMGSAVILRNDQRAFFLGDARLYGDVAWIGSSNKQLNRQAIDLPEEDESEKDKKIADNSVGSKLQEMSKRFLDRPQQSSTTTTSARQLHGYAVITYDGEVLIVAKEHIQQFVDSEDSLTPSVARRLLDLLPLSQLWTERSMSVVRSSPFYVSNINSRSVDELERDGLLSKEELEIVLPAYRHFMDQFTPSAQSPPPTQPLPGSILKQQEVIAEIEQDLAAHPVTASGEGEAVVKAMNFLSQMKDPKSFLNANNASSGSSSSGSEVYAWRMFRNVMHVLQDFGALSKDGTQASELGLMVSSLSTDNDLWVALILSETDLMAKLNPLEFASLLAALSMDSFKVKSAQFRASPSDAVIAVVEQLNNLYADLRIAQDRYEIEFPLLLTPEVCGLALLWARGCSWRELCAATSLDQGDLYRMLKRTVELLKQIPEAYHVDYNVVEKARLAARALDRFPIADTLSESDDTNPPVAVATNTTDPLAMVQEDEEENDSAGESDDDEEDFDALQKLIDEVEREDLMRNRGEEMEDYAEVEKYDDHVNDNENKVEGEEEEEDVSSEEDEAHQFVQAPLPSKEKGKKNKNARSGDGFDLKQRKADDVETLLKELMRETSRYSARQARLKALEESGQVSSADSDAEVLIEQGDLLVESDHDLDTIEHAEGYYDKSTKTKYDGKKQKGKQKNPKTKRKPMSPQDRKSKQQVVEEKKYRADR